MRHLLLLVLFSSFLTGCLSPAPLQVSSPTFPPLTVGEETSAAFIVSGGEPPYEFAVVAGALPPGLALDAGTLTGAPSQAGPFGFTIEVRDAAGRIERRPNNVSVYAALALGPSLPAADVGVAYSVRIVASGGRSPITITRTGGTLPVGLTFDGDRIHGVANEPGTYELVFSATDADGRTANQTVTLQVNDHAAGLSVTSGAPPDGYVGAAYVYALTFEGSSAAPTWTISTGALPTGLSLDATTGLVSGTPGAAGSSTVTFEVAADGAQASGARTFAIYAPPTLSAATLPDATRGSTYAFAFTASGGKSATFSASALELPPGLSLSTGGTLSGTPTASGSYTFDVRYSDLNGRSDTETFTLLVVSDSTTEPAILKVGSWNIEWLGAADGPSDDALQVTNAADVIRRADQHVWGLAELVGQSAFDELLGKLGPSYSGFMANAATVTDGTRFYGADEQKTGVIYRTDVVTVLGQEVVLGDAWASDGFTRCTDAFGGRPPLEVRVRLTVDGQSTTARVLVLHAKAFADASSYDRRRLGASCLYSYLDALPSTENVLVLGDFNDDVDVSIVHTSQHSTCTPVGSWCESPYEVLTDHPALEFATKELSLGGYSSTPGYSDMIDHHLAGGPMVDGYVSGSAEVLRPDLWSPAVADYENTTSDHYPVVTRYTLD